MNNFAIDWYFISLLVFVGLYAMLASRSIIRQLIGLEIVSKAAMLAIITAGALTSNLMLAQALIITMIVVEVVVVAAGLALLVKAHRISGSADIWKLDSLKG
ncbi:MAG: hypothetical protein A2234_00920 [Elusimicrobia bacterium RIFOXYA2_FULL_58_8]|nr:MAG: hypothetical protein A2285_05675 [Elusimicrobia bacterium RIFOXYA12_FULL_57_11]OGS13654.1 MAG: hypothetical protein A2234_00920 [Elusimicrobia bacterium RIFOXYA2_FULL_58_8]